MASISNKTPIAQFLIDIFCLYVLKHNLTINEFMEKSKFLSMLSHDSKPWILIRRHLSEYLKYIYKPIHQNMSIHDGYTEDHDYNDDHKYDERHVFRHNMSGILYYTSIIHDNLYILNKVCQIDVVFIPHSLKWINEKYFDELGIKYEKLGDVKKQYIKEMMRHFNEKLDDAKFKRCVILIMDNSDVCEDAVYIFQPLQNKSLPPQLLNYTEMPWICNTKSDFLPGSSLNDSNALCLSIHRHQNDDGLKIERVYFSYHSYGARVFKHNLKDILKPFCVENQQYYPVIDWQDEINNKEFDDHQFNIFTNAYFADQILMII